MTQIEIPPGTPPLRHAVPAEPACTVELATIWSRFLRRGPREYLLNSITRLANFVR